MISKRQKIAASGAALAAGAGLILVLAGGSAGASAPHTSPTTAPGDVVVTRSVPPGAVITPDPKAPRPTLTISATPAPGGATRAVAPGTRTVVVTPGATVQVEPGSRPTATVYATTPAG